MILVLFIVVLVLAPILIREIEYRSFSSKFNYFQANSHSDLTNSEFSISYQRNQFFFISHFAT